jgi:hypothetical protein
MVVQVVAFERTARNHAVTCVLVAGDGQTTLIFTKIETTPPAFEFYILKLCVQCENTCLLFLMFSISGFVEPCELFILSTHIHDPCLKVQKRIAVGREEAVQTNDCL